MRRVAGPAGAAYAGKMAVNAQALANVRVQQLEEQARGGARSAGMYSIYTGKKPDLPNKFYFQSLILSTDKPARIRSQYVKGTLGLPAAVVFVAIIALACYVGWRRSARPSWALNFASAPTRSPPPPNRPANA